MKLAILILLFFNSPAFAGVEEISEQEFRALANELSHKVNLFQEVWRENPEAIFYGGTTRDFLYWLKRQFQSAHSRQDAEKIIHSLRLVPLIDVREFIIGDSDVDVIADSKPSFRPENFGVRKFDALSPEIFDYNSDLGKNELWQGHAPAEKIRLGKNGISQAPELGDGLKEIYHGRLSVHFADPIKFAETKYAKAGENHPVLLALRYLRLQAINYFNTYGSGYPDADLLKKGLEANSEKAVQEILRVALHDQQLAPFLNNKRFLSWFNGTIQKAFRSYTNPTAALEYMKMFHVDQLPNIYGEELVQPLYQYVFQKFHDPKQIEKHFEELGIDRKRLFEKKEQHFPDGYLYHGTKDENAFRSMIFQGVLPSSDGSAGAGLYGVPEAEKQFAETWGGSRDRLVRFAMQPKAKIVDITRGYGQEIWLKFAAEYGYDPEKFADYFGIDILRYPYESADAYVVKNSAAIGRGQGVYRQLMSFSELFEKAKTIKDPKLLIDTMKMNQLSKSETRAILKDRAQFLAESISSINDLPTLREILLRISDLRDPEFVRVLERILEVHGEILEELHNSFLQQIVAAWATNPKALQVIQKQSVMEPHLRQVLNFLKTNSPTYGSPKLLADFLYDVSEISSELFSELIQKENLDLALHTTQLKADLKSRVFSKLYKPEYAPLVQQLNSRDPTHSFNDVIFQQWAKHPELLEIYLHDHPFEARVGYEKIIQFGFAMFPLWQAHKELLGKFLNRYVFYAQPIPALEHSGWEGDISVLRQMSTQMNSNDSSVRGMVFHCLQVNDLWKKDPQLLLSIIPKLPKNSNYHYYYLLQSDLWNYPKIMEAIIEVLDKHQIPFGLAQQLSRKEWLAHPAILQKLIRIDSEGYYQLPIFTAIAEILASPHWAKHPELLEELALLPNQSIGAYKIADLLELPHWRDHPAYRHLLVRGKLGYAEFHKYALDRAGKSGDCEKIYRRLSF